MKITTKLIDYRTNSDGDYICDFNLSSWNDKDLTYQQSKAFINMARNWANNFNRLFPDFIMNVNIFEDKVQDNLIIHFQIDYTPVPEPEPEEPTDDPAEIHPPNPGDGEDGEDESGKDVGVDENGLPTYLP